jgi:hypothetical protein
MVWELEGMKRQCLISSEDEVCWNRLSAYYAQREIGARVIRKEEMLVSMARSCRGSYGGGGAALSKNTLHRALQMQRELERRLLEGDIEGLGCVARGGVTLRALERVDGTTRVLLVDTAKAEREGKRAPSKSGSDHCRVVSRPM